MPFLYHFVTGLPAPQGSKSFKGTFKRKDGRMGGILVESSKKVGPWRDSVAAQLLAGTTDRFGDAAVRLTVVFVMPRPKAMSAKKPTPHHVKAPDLSKLIRSTEDAITTAGIWADDSRVAEYGPMLKRYAEPGEATGAMIMIEALPEKEEPIGKAEKQQPAKRAGRGNGQRRGRARAGAVDAGDGCPYFV
jgi:crossover junction endodeoxyribonuclease RusA